MLWGEFTKSERADASRKFIPVNIKRLKLNEIKKRPPKTVGRKSVNIKMKNPLVTQTIEVMKQTEMLQSLIDTYSNKSGSPNDLSPCQMIPEVDFPPENSADFIINDEKFAKPTFFIPPKENCFALSLPTHYPEINTEVCQALIRKAVCGQLRATGFTDSVDSAITLFSDAAVEFLRILLTEIGAVCSHNHVITIQRVPDIALLEKSYYSITSNSLTQLYHYFKQVIAKNRIEIAEYNGVRLEYDKLMKDSLTIVKHECQLTDGIENADHGYRYISTAKQQTDVSTRSSQIVEGIV
ncbi:uncharacterized protein LOC119668404 [Teleopsis dalmanni]|uniref:uncharacterized protein LOC119668404 n=1 Tax=Teleopsis dalmanni TaxID=139649 RepID=UPI0018CDC698|nr:uncharacterized protein LOC119668404 [Teleopsis dalmanni]